MIKPASPTPLAALLLGATLALGSSACGSGEGPEVAPAPSSGAPVSPSESEASPSAAPETGAEREAEPATGPRVRLPVLQVRLPDDTWTPSPVQGGFGGGFTEDGTGQLFVNQFPTISSDPSLDQLAEIRLEQLRRDESFPVAIGDEVTVDGIGGVSLEGSGGGTHVFVLETLVLQPEPLAVAVEIRTRGGEALHRERVESVLASWQWR